MHIGKLHPKAAKAAADLVRLEARLLAYDVLVQVVLFMQSTVMTMV